MTSFIKDKENKVIFSHVYQKVAALLTCVGTIWINVDI